MGGCFSSDDERVQGRQYMERIPGNDFSTSPTKSNKVEVSSVKSMSGTPMASKNVKDLRQSPGYSNVDIFTYEIVRGPGSIKTKTT